MHFARECYSDSNLRVSLSHEEMSKGSVKDVYRFQTPQTVGLIGGRSEIGFGAVLGKAARDPLWPATDSAFDSVHRNR